MEPVPGYRFANWELGYGDFLWCLISTRCASQWLDKTAFVHCDVRGRRRTIRQHRAAFDSSASARCARRWAIQAFAASELEHYLFRKSYREAHEQDYRDLEPGGWYLEDYHMLQGTRTKSSTRPFAAI